MRGLDPVDEPRHSIGTADLTSRRPRPATAHEDFASAGDSIDRAALVLVMLGLAGVGVLVVAWLRMIVSPAPQEMREGAVLWSTLALLHGQNPYALDALPRAANLYGPLYPLVVALVSPVLGQTLMAHRIVNAVGILVACGLLHHVLRQRGASPMTALAGAAINLAGLLYWVGPTARPDGLGLALALGAYVAMAPAPDNPRRFAIGLLLSMAGFAAKIYYVVPIVSAIVWIGWRRGLLRAAAAALTAAAALALTIVALSIVFPGWAPLVLGANLRATTYDVDHLFAQTIDWAIFSLPLLVALAGTAWGRGWQRQVWAPDLWTIALLCGVGAVAMALGGHRGAHMTYFFHLVTPALTVVALAGVDRRAITRLAFAASLPMAALANAHWFTLDAARFARAEATFARVGAAIARASRPAATGEFAALLLAAGVRPLETGHSEYGSIPAPPLVLEPVWGRLDEAAAEERRFARRFYSALHEGTFDLIVANRRRLDLFTPDLLAGRYRVVDELQIDMPWARQAWPVDVWVPNRPGGAPWPATAVPEHRK